MISYRYNAPSLPVTPKPITREDHIDTIIKRIETFRAKHNYSTRKLSIMIKPGDVNLLYRIIVLGTKPKQVTIDAINRVIGVDHGTQEKIQDCSFRL